MSAQPIEHLATPAGVLVYDGPPHTEQWYAARRDGITATDLPKILGVSQYGNATTVWLDKRGLGDEDTAGEAAGWGTILEPIIADEWASREGAAVQTVGILASTADTWLRASLDYQVARCPDGEGPCGLECKARSEYKAGDWSEDVPDDVYIQTQGQMLVSGYRHMHVAVLIGGNRLRSFRVDLDPEDAAHILSEARRVWQDVLNGTPPADHPGDLLSKALDRVYPRREGELLLEGQALATCSALVAEYRSALEAEKDAKERKSAARSLLAQLLADHDAAVIEGRAKPVLTLKTQTRAAHTVAESTSSTLRIAPSFQTAQEVSQP